MNATSAWLLAANAKLNNPELVPDFDGQASGYAFKIFFIDDSCWLVAAWPRGSRIAFRLAYAPNDHLTLKSLAEDAGTITLQIGSLMGGYEVKLTLPGEGGVLRATTTLKTAAPVLFPYWPRDIVSLGAAGSDVLPEGDIRISQAGTRSGQLYFSLTRPKAGSVLYMQNLSALADYNQ